MKALLKNTKEIIDIHWNDGWIKDTEPKAWLNRNEFDILGYTGEEVREQIERAIETDRKEQLIKALQRPTTIAIAQESIDWEQRRYEIAKDVMCAHICSPIIPGIDPNPSLEELSRHACAAADTLIATLKAKCV